MKPYSVLMAIVTDIHKNQFAGYITEHNDYVDVWQRAAVKIHTNGDHVIPLPHLPKELGSSLIYYGRIARIYLPANTLIQERVPLAKLPKIAVNEGTWINYYKVTERVPGIQVLLPEEVAS